MKHIKNNFIDTERLERQCPNCKKYRYQNSASQLLFSCEKNDNGDWNDTTEIELLKIEIAKESKELNKLEERTDENINLHTRPVRCDT